MALCCDIRIASDDARFGPAGSCPGHHPAAGGTQTLPRAVGTARALDMLLLNRWIDADEAHKIGLVNRVVLAESSFPGLDENGGAHRLPSSGRPVCSQTVRCPGTGYGPRGGIGT